MIKKALLAPAILLASTSAFAQAVATDQTDHAASDTSVEEIVVTAQKREQSLQDVSAAVSALGANQIANARISSISDLQSIVPSVNFGSDFNQAKIFIRGVGANTSTTGSSTGVAFHVDGAYIARAEAQLTSLFDLERIEVLRGPQGTLYGRNAVGGSINVITAKPTNYLEGYGRVSYGNYNALTSEAAISGPITEGIRARLAIKTEDRDGFGVNPVSGKDVDDLNRRMARAQVEFDLGPKANLLVAAEYFRQSDASGAIHYLRASFPGVARLAPLGVGGYATNPRDLATESSPGTETETYAFTGTLTVPLNDTLTISNIANYRSFKSSLFQDLDLSAVIDSLPTNGQATTVQERRIDSKQWSNELRLGLQSEWVNGTIGLFYFHERQRPIDNVGLANRNGMAQNIGVLQAAGIDLNEAYALCGYTPDGVTGGSTIIAPKRVCTHSNLGTDAFSIFGQYSIGLGMFSEGLSAFNVKLGGRWSSEHVESENASIVITRNGVGPVLRFTAAGTHVEKTFRDFTPEAGLEWKPSKDLLVYYTYSEGFKAGSGENASGSTTIVNPEKMYNHEAGIKASFGRMLTLNLAGYAYTLNGLQLNKTIAGGPTGYTTIFQNAAKTRAKGVEIDVLLRPTQGLRLSGALSYTDAHFVDYLTLDPLNPANIMTPGAPAYNAVTNPDLTAYGSPSGGNIQLAGNDTRNSPRWAWSVHGEYEMVSPVGRFTPSVDVSYKGRTYFSEYERAIESSAAYTLVDLSLAYETSNGRIRAQLWTKNLFDIFRPSSTFALATGRLLGATWLPPRTYGVSLGYKF